MHTMDIINVSLLIVLVAVIAVVVFKLSRLAEEEKKNKALSNKMRYRKMARTH
jgi:hypothetical protein